MSTEPRRPLALRFVEATLKLYPRSFRREYGPSILEGFEGRFRRASQSGSILEKLRVWAWFALDLVWSVPREHLSVGFRIRSEFGRSARSRWFIESVLQDIQLGIRSLRRRPLFTAVVVLTLGLGIGAATSVFTLVDAALLRPFPYRNADRLVVIRGDRTRAEANSPFMSGSDIMDIRREARAFVGVGYFSEPFVVPMTQVDRPLHVMSAWTSADLFQVLGVEAVVGGAFEPEVVPEMVADTTIPGLAMLGYGFWQRVFGCDTAVVGSSVRISGRPFTVTGVLPEDFMLRMPRDFGAVGDLDVYTALPPGYADTQPNWWWARVVARLRDGTTLPAAAAELDALAVRFQSQRAANAEQGTRFRVESLTGSVIEGARATLDAFVVAVSLLLMIACANVANLLLVRGTGRAPELAVRSVLGAGRHRIARQLLVECAVLCVLGAGLGVVLAIAAVDLLGAAASAIEVLHVREERLDARMLAFAAVMAVVSTVTAGLVPSIRVTAQDFSSRLGSRSGIGGHHRFAASLAVSQVALSVALLTGVGLMVRTVVALQSAPLGFEPEDVLTATVTQGYRSPEERHATEAALLREVSSLPGVRGVGLAFPLPMNGVYERTIRYVDALEEADPRAWRDASFLTISSGYLDAAGISITLGRGFTEADESGEYPVSVVDEVLARQTWPAEDPLGNVVTVVGMEPGDTLRFEIVGVAEYAPQWDRRHVQPTLYFPRAFYRTAEVSLALRVEEDLLSLAGPLREAIRRVEPDLPVDVMPMEQYVSEALGPTRFVLLLLGVFASVAVGLTGVGLYSVLAYGVRQRTSEIGIRMALGADAGTVLKAVTYRGWRLALMGTGLGLGGALVLGRLLHSHLFQVEVTDPAALLGSVVAILLVAGLASWFPARYAAAVDPVEALSTE
jgi:predicted permease